MDAEAFTGVINKIVENFVKKLGGDFFEEVYIGVSHPEMLVNRIVEGKRIMDDEVDGSDVEHLSRIVAEISSKNNYETIKIVPVCWIIDEDKKEKDPVGLRCKKLELMADVFLIPKNFYNALIDAFDKVGLSIADVVPNIIAVSELTIDYDHKDLGTVLIDIGKNQTSYVIYEDGYALGYGTIPLGGEDVTKDISIGMQIDIREAEELKKTQGTAVIADVISSDPELDVAFLSDIINARYEEIFFKVDDHLKRIEKDGRLPGGVLLIGGASKMVNLDLLAKTIFKLATFYGKDLLLNLGDLSFNIQFLNLLGVYHWSNKYTDVGSRKINFKSLKVGNLAKKIGDFFRNLF